MVLSFDNFFKIDCRSTPVDYNLYRRFWALQDYFRKPTQCYDKVPWKAFQQVKCLYIYNVEFKTVSKCFVFDHLNLPLGFQCYELHNLHTVYTETHNAASTGNLFTCFHDRYFLFRMLM